MRRSLVISLLMHVLFLAGLVLSGSIASRSPLSPTVYRINLVAAPPGEVLRPRREPPRPQPPAPEKKPETKPKPEPEIKEKEKEVVPDKKAQPVLKVKPRPEPAEKGPESKAEPPPEPPTPEPITPESGGNDADIDVDIEGKPFPFPGYLERMVNKIGRNWKQGGNPEPLHAVVYFRVERNGRVSGIEVRETSGSFLFDQGTMRAVADASPLPPLPDGYTGDYLGVFFDFNEERLE
jgi:TonB family protein